MFTDGLSREARTLLIDTLWAVLAAVVLALPMLATTHESAVAAVLWSLLMICALAVRRRYPLIASASAGSLMRPTATVGNPASFLTWLDSGS